MDPPLDYADPQTWDGFWYVVLGEQFRGSFGPLPAAGELLRDTWTELVRDLGMLVVLAVAGVLLGLFRHPRLTALGLLWFGCTWLFAVGYPNAAIERYYLVPLLVAALAIGLAVDAVWDALRDLLGPGGHGRAYRMATTGLVLGLLLLAIGPGLARFDRLDASADGRGRAIIDSTFEVLEPEAVVISWWSYSTPLWYGQHVEGRRPDVTIIDDRDILDDGYGDTVSAVEAHLGERPVYLIQHEPAIANLSQDFQLVPVVGVPMRLYRVVAERADQ